MQCVHALALNQLKRSDKFELQNDDLLCLGAWSRGFPFIES